MVLWLGCWFSPSDWGFSSFICMCSYELSSVWYYGLCVHVIITTVSFKIYSTINICVLLFPHPPFPSPSLTMLSLWQPFITPRFYNSAIPRMLINRSCCIDAFRLGSFWVYSLDIHLAVVYIKSLFLYNAG